jgi:hypothetical protein
MIDESTAELIHADIDDCLSAEHRAELSGILLVDPEARAFHRDMQRLQRELAVVETAEVPAGLAESIMAAIHAADAAPSRHEPWRDLRYGLALAASVAVVAVTLWIGGREDDIDGTAAVGTMSSGDRASAPVTIDRPEVSGSIRLLPMSDTLLVEVDVAPRDDVEVTARQGDAWVSAKVQADAAGRRQHLVLELPAGQSGPVSVQFTARGRFITEAQFDGAVVH